METYPDICISHDSERNPVDSHNIEISSNGEIRGQKLFDASVYEFVIKHPLITDAEVTTLKAFYAANETISFVYVDDSDGASYNLIFEQEPIYQKATYSGWNVTVLAQGTAV